MDKLVIKGGKKLHGEIQVSAAKNACLPIIFSTILSDQQVTLNNIPKLRDINTSVKLLEDMGAKVSFEDKKLKINCSQIKKTEASYELVKTMRASILVLGPLLARFGKARVSLPGGCAIGGRPVDLHLSGLELMGAKIELENGYVNASTKGLHGADIELSFPSVGATENLMMAASLASGETIIRNAAKEPEITDLANFLNSMGASIVGAGTDLIRIEGKTELRETTYRPIGDRIEGATWVMAGLITRSKIKVLEFDPEHISSVIDTLKLMGANLEIGDNFVKVLESKLSATNMSTAPYPGFPTDAQAQMMTLMCSVEGVSSVDENIFENRFMHVPELTRMGAKIILEGKRAIIEGDIKFRGAPVMCTDLRASAALVMAALVSEEETEISRVYHLDRGYEAIEEKLKILGANIVRIK
ncbi:MAG: UDP-N-acetylglucosamine 1-carboxyvinyltransferase [Halobacteriovoraceae bacterium]|nr:UDP-N-acetylglucosamine 1-carboxyvinyltransferase [Halobacteriovoraceae bacterium]